MTASVAEIGPGAKSPALVLSKHHREEHWGLWPRPSLLTRRCRRAVVAASRQPPSLHSRRSRLEVNGLVGGPPVDRSGTPPDRRRLTSLLAGSPASPANRRLPLARRLLAADERSGRRTGAAHASHARRPPASSRRKVLGRPHSLLAVGSSGSLGLVVVSHKPARWAWSDYPHLSMWKASCRPRPEAQTVA